MPALIHLKVYSNCGVIALMPPLSCNTVHRHSNATSLYAVNVTQVSPREKSQNREPSWKRWLPHSGHSQIIHKLCPHCFPCMHYNSTSNNMIENTRTRDAKKLLPPKFEKERGRMKAGRGCKQEVEKAWRRILALFCSSLICFVFGFQVKVCWPVSHLKGVAVSFTLRRTLLESICKRELLRWMWPFTYIHIQGTVSGTLDFLWEMRNKVALHHYCSKTPFKRPERYILTSQQMLMRWNLEPKITTHMSYSAWINAYT